VSGDDGEAVGLAAGGAAVSDKVEGGRQLAELGCGCGCGCGA